MKGLDTKRRTVYIFSSQWGANKQFQQKNDMIGAGFYEYFLPRCAEQPKAGRH